jgi:hypothetical protein
MTAMMKYAKHKIIRISLICLLALSLISVAEPPARAQSPRTINDLFVQLGDTVQGFGGMYVDPEKDTLYVWVVPGQRLTPMQIKLAIRDVFGRDMPAESNLVTLDAQYSFRQLLSWQDYSDGIFSIADVVSAGIHHRTNRLEIGVSNDKARKAVEAKLNELGVPVDAVEVVHEDPLRPAADEKCTSVQSKCRPVVAGLQIQTKKGNCTLGFSATGTGDDKKEYPGFVTAGHCANQEFRNTGTLYYQNEVADGKKIGKEAKNPPLVEGPWEYNERNKCFKGEKCRLSDSLFAKYEGDLDAVKDVKVGFIARPKLGGTDWNGTDYFRIVAPGKSVEGANIAKVGRSTGWTEGKVLRVCATARFFQQRQAFLCQNRADLPFQEGDSGGPVFACTPATEPCSKLQVFDVALLGIVANGNSSHMYYSDIGLIMNDKTELGKLTRFCDPEVKDPVCPK